LATLGIYFPQKLAQQFGVLFHLRIANWNILLPSQSLLITMLELHGWSMPFYLQLPRFPCV
jgi:hypothetical protein